MSRQQSNTILTSQNLSAAWFKYLNLLSTTADKKPGFTDRVTCLFRGTTPEKLKTQLEIDTDKAHNLLFKTGDLIRLAVLLSQMSQTYHGDLAKESGKLADLLISPLAVPPKTKAYFHWLKSNLPTNENEQLHGGLSAIYNIYARHIENWTPEATPKKKYKSLDSQINDLSNMTVAFEIVLPLQTTCLERMKQMAITKPVVVPPPQPKKEVALNNWRSLPSLGYQNKFLHAPKVVRKITFKKSTQPDIMAAPLIPSN